MDSKNFTQIISDRFATYAKYIIQERALPDARDGLKPVQRRILYAMHTDHNTYNHKYKKSVKAVGLVIANYHPHGDSSVYDALVRMSQPWKNHQPLIDMQGNNGSIDDDPAAAMRYTESRLSLIADYMLFDIDKETISMALNFDDTTYEPTVLPNRYPNLLTSGISGIAAGYATNIPPHNLKECIDACIFRLQNPNCELEEIMRFIKGPDFPTGGIVHGEEGIIQAFSSGKGKVQIRGKCDIIKEKKVQYIIITEIPYEVVKSNLVRKIDEIRFQKTIDGILDVRDESNRDGIKIVIELKKDIDANMVLQYLYKHSELQVNYNYNMVAIVNQVPKLMSLLQMIDTFLQHRELIVLKATQFDINKLEKRLHIVEGLIKCIHILDDVIATIRSSKDKEDAIEQLIVYYDFTLAQATAIVNLRLYRLTNTDIVALEEECQSIYEELSNLNAILNDKKIRHQYMIDQLNEVKEKFGEERKSIIEEEIQTIQIDQKELIASEEVMFSLTKDGYLKRSSLRSFGSSDFLPNCKENDQFVAIEKVSTTDQLLFFTNKGNYGYFDVYLVADQKWKEVGNHLNTMLTLEVGEKIVGVYSLETLETYGYIVLATKNGMIKKVKIKDLQVSRNNKLFTAISLQEDDELINTQYSGSELNEIVCVSENGYYNRYPIAEIKPSKTNSKGIKAINLSDDNVAFIAVLTSHYLYAVVFSNENKSKRIRIDQLEKASRTSKGKRLFKQQKTNPLTVKDFLLANNEDELVFIGQNEIKIQVKNITLMDNDATFSNSCKLDKEVYLLHPLKHITNQKIVVDNDNELLLQFNFED